MKPRPFFLALLSVILANGCTPTDRESTVTVSSRPPLGFEVGKPFPALTLPALDGAPGSVADFRGKKLILHVFASW